MRLFVSGNGGAIAGSTSSRTAGAGLLGDHHYDSHFVAGRHAATCLAAGMDAYLNKRRREADLLRVLSAFSSAPALEHAQTQLEEATSDQY